MSEPYWTLWAITCLLLFAVSGGILIHCGLKHRNTALFLLCMALVIWPIAGEFINASARHLARESLRAGDTSLLGIWQETPGGFLTKVAAIVYVIQAVLVFATSLSIAKATKKRTVKASDATSGPAPGAGSSAYQG